MGSPLYGIRMTRNGEDGDGGRYVHAEGSGLVGSHTLCGYTDLPGEKRVRLKSAKDIDCPSCLDVIRTAARYL